MIQCEVEERVVRSVKTVVVKCFKCEGKGHKCRECPLWERKVKRVARPREEKAHQGERRLRRMEEKKMARPVKGKSTVKIEEELDRRVKKESKGTL